MITVNKTLQNRRWVSDLPVACTHRSLSGAGLSGIEGRCGWALTGKVSRVGDDDGSGLLELVEGGGHGGREQTLASGHFHLLIDNSEAVTCRSRV